MANKYAITNGNWSDGSIWNDGVVPGVDDDVWLDGHTVTSSNNISVKSIRNTENPDTGNQGGYINLTTSSKTINANLYSITTLLSMNLSAYNYGLAVNGDIHHSGNVYCILGRSFNYLNVTGNIELSGNLVSFDTRRTITIVGNVEGDTNSELTNSTSDVIINGNLKSGNTSKLTSLNVSGKISLPLNRYLNVANLTVGIGLEYENSNNKTGYNYDTINIVNPDLFYYRDITSPHFNEFFIISNAELNNLQQYPQESDVKNGVEYAYGLKEGSYTPNFPQEATVLKDVEYDDGNKVGTLEVVQGTLVENATIVEGSGDLSVVNLTEEQVQRVGDSLTAEMAQTMLQQYFG